MRSIRLVSVIGGSECSQAQASFAERAGSLIAEAGFGVVCGGRSGVMEAVCRGAWLAEGFTLGILPSINPEGANAFITIALPTGLHEARNVLVVLAGEAVLAIGGGFGTLSEIAHAIRMGKQVVGYQTWEGRGSDIGELPIHRVESPEQAVSMLKNILKIDP